MKHIINLEESIRNLLSQNRKWFCVIKFENIKLKCILKGDWYGAKLLVRIRYDEVEFQEKYKFKHVISWLKEKKLYEKFETAVEEEILRRL